MNNIVTDAVADFKKCGAGTADCCIFLIGGANGAECARFTPFHNVLAARAAKGLMRAQYAPHGSVGYPDCQPNPNS